MLEKFIDDKKFPFLIGRIRTGALGVFVSKKNSFPFLIGRIRTHKTITNNIT